jgi:starch synthase
VFEKALPESFAEAVERALEAWRDSKAWTRLIQTAMKKDFTWAPSARKYLEVFRSLAGSGE